MVHAKNAIISGVVATFVAGSMMMMNNALHSIPEVHVARTLAGILGHPDAPVVGWIAFLSLGILVCGPLFAAGAPRIPGRSYLVKALLFGVVSWLAMMLIMMPLAGAGFFGVNRGHVLALATLVLNLSYWLTLGGIFRYLAGPETAGIRSTT